MGGILKKDIALSLFISLTYFIFWALAIFISGSGNIHFWLKSIVPFTWQLLYVTFLNFLLHLIAVPYIRRTKPPWPATAVTILAMLLLLTIGFSSWIRLGEMISVYASPKSQASAMDSAVKNVLFQLFGMGYFASIKFFIDFYRLRSKNQQLIIEKKISELNYLKSQTNPHFLFNTLNNIYLLAREKSELAPESLLRLSELLRYMLYETTGELVPAEKEIRILEDYIELEKMRYDDMLVIEFAIEADDINRPIPPLLMIPLVENAFKHGLSETIGKPFIHIAFVLQNDMLRFTVENSTGSFIPIENIKEGIGIKNLRRQLELMFTESELKLESRSTSFFVQMFINLRSYAKN